MPTQMDESAALKFVVTNTLIVNDIQRSVAFYRDVLGATVLREGEPTFLRLGNIWLTINGGGDPTDIKRDYELWSTRARTSSRSRRSMQRNCGATCVTRTDTD